MREMFKKVDPSKLTIKQTILLEEIAEDFNQYLLNGNLFTFFKEFTPDLKINNIEELLKIHFILTETDKNKLKEIGVIDFLEQLPARIRRIKTTINPAIVIYDGFVKNKINWNNTIKQRLNHYPSGETLYACEISEKKYDIPENLVLKELLRTLHNIAFKDLNIISRNKDLKEKQSKDPTFNWLSKWVDYSRKQKRLLDILEEIYHKNVYIKRINFSPKKVTDKMIQRALQSRFLLYREAAFLLKKYRKLMNYEFESDLVKELLINTFIVPDRESVLFELYWVIKIVRAFKNRNPKNFKYELRKLDENLVASWILDGFKYYIYHNSVGDFNFLIKGELKDFKEKLHFQKDKTNFLDNFIGREIKINKKLYDLLGTEFEWSGRPDILLEKFDKNENIISILIGEVKNSSNKDYAIYGLRQLLEYISLIKYAKEGPFIEKFENLFESLNFIRGILFTDEIEGFSIKDDKNLRLVMFGKENLGFKDILGEL